MAWLQGSALGHAMRESGVWTYGIVNLIHILGVASLFGAVLVLDLRLLGAWRSISLAAITTPTVPMATMMRYALDLRSITKGRGRFRQSVDHYEELPHPEQQALVTEYAKQRAAHEQEH